MEDCNVAVTFTGLPVVAGCDRPVRIMPLGDSITTGSSSLLTDNNYKIGYRQKLYLDLISAGDSVDFVGSLQSGASVPPSFDLDHEGHPGYYAYEPANATNVANNVFNWLGQNPADVILLHIGTNDISNGSAAASDVAVILDEIKRYAQSYGVTPPTVVLARIITRFDGLETQTTTLTMQLWPWRRPASQTAKTS